MTRIWCLQRTVSLVDTKKRRRLDRGQAFDNEHKAFTKRPAGRIIEVTFFDGETLVGTSLTYDASRPGFFLFPADPQSNNVRVFVVRAATTSVRPVPPVMPQAAPPAG